MVRLTTPRFSGQDTHAAMPVLQLATASRSRPRKAGWSAATLCDDPKRPCDLERTRRVLPEIESGNAAFLTPYIDAFCGTGDE